jgi:hypothetical protein
MNPKNPGKTVKARDVVFIETASRNSNNNSDPEEHIECANDSEVGTTVEGEQNMTGITIQLPPENNELE